MTHRLKCKKRRKLSNVDGGKLRLSETSARKHSGELDVQPSQEIKKGSRQRRRGTKRFVKMRIAARAHYPVYFSSRFHMLSRSHCYVKYYHERRHGQTEKVDSIQKTQKEMNSIKIQNSNQNKFLACMKCFQRRIAISDRNEKLQNSFNVFYCISITFLAKKTKTGKS